jgi:HD-like signal output (HDOD) protein
MDTAQLAGHLVAERVLCDIREALASDRLRLPVLPEAVIRLRAVLADPASTLQDLARTLGLDPALAARLLRVANSAYYGAMRQVDSLPQALIRLGHDAIERTVMMLGVAELYRGHDQAATRERVRSVWEHSVQVAALSGELAPLAGARPDAALLVGLIHDVGALPVLAWVANHPALLLEPAVLDQLVDALHVPLGRELLERWRLPPALVDAVAVHEDFSRDPGTAPDLGDVVIVANRMTRAGGLPAEVEPIPAWRRLGLDPERAAEIWSRGQSGAADLRRMLFGQAREAGVRSARPAVTARGRRP